MKIMAFGDIHLRKQSPIARTDDYFGVQMNKLRWAFDLAETEQCSAVIWPGDVTDSPTVSHEVVHAAIEEIKKRTFRVLCVLGQHDTFYHRMESYGTPTGVMVEAGVLHLLSSTPFVLGDGDDQTAFYGASWGIDPPSPADEQTSVLALHKMLISGELWKDQDAQDAKNFLIEQNGYDFIVSGDNHQSFHVETDSRYLVNCGSLTRSTIAQVEHKPIVWIYDTKEQTCNPHEIPIEPEVFDYKLIRESKKNKEMEKLADALGENVVLSGLDFKANVRELLKQEKPLPVVEAIIHELCDGEENGR